MAKYFAGEVAAEAALEAMRVLGGYRYSPEFPVERLYRDAPIADRRGVDERGAAARHRPPSVRALPRLIAFRDSCPRLGPVLTCPSCGKENPDGFAFCGYCTAPLAERPTPGLEERKIVTVLFCDLVGFTAASEQQDPEDVQARIRPYHARLRQEIERYGGTVEKFIGDAVMAAFGAPVAHEDDAERAVRAGLRVVEAIEELNQADHDLDLQVRVGINTGEAVVVLGARAEHGEGFVSGDVVNTAARIQGAGPVSGVTVGEQTYRATRAGTSTTSRWSRFP